MEKIESKTGCIEIANFLDSKLFEEIIDFTKKNLDLLALNTFKNKNLELTNRIIKDKKFQKITEEYSGIKFRQLRKKMTININTKIPLFSTDTNLHYDNCYINWVIPLWIENKKNPGLIIFPNSRKKIFLFLVLKFLTSAIKSKYLLRLPLFLNFLGAYFIKYKINHAYIFDGYNSLHGVVWSKNDGVRCVITINFSR
jgi:hypothetical protein